LMHSVEQEVMSDKQPRVSMMIVMGSDLIEKICFEEEVYEYGMLSLITALPPTFIHPMSTVHIRLNGLTVRTSIVPSTDSATITLYVCMTL